MKKIILICAGALGLGIGAFAQTQTPTAPPASAAPGIPLSTTAPVTVAPPAVTIAPPSAPPLATIPPSATMTVTVSPTPNDADDDIDRKIAKKIHHHFNITTDGNHDDDAAWMAVPIVFIVFLAIFGTPVMIVAVIMFFSYSRTRAMHKTVRMMVEKGQPVPESLLNPPPIVRQRSDLRRGIKWLLWGVGLMIFFGACNDWEGGAWSLGMIPFLIGCAYIIFWRLDAKKEAPSPKV